MTAVEGAVGEEPPSQEDRLRARSAPHTGCAADVRWRPWRSRRRRRAGRRRRRGGRPRRTRSRAAVPASHTRCRPIARARSQPRWPPHSVRIAPGSITMTCTPCGASSTRSESLSPSTANFVAWYQAPSGSYILPPIDETFTIRTAVLRAQVREDELGEPREPEDVDLELAAGLLHRHVLERAVGPVAGVVHEHVDAALLARGCARRPRSSTRHPSRPSRSRAPRGPRARHAVDAARGAVHGEAAACEFERGGLADAR